MSALPPEFLTLSSLIRRHGETAPKRVALEIGSASLDYAGLDQWMDRIAAALQGTGIRSGEVIAICADTTIEYAAMFLGALRAGVVVAPLPLGSTGDSLARMMRDAGAKLVATDSDRAGLLHVQNGLTADGIPVIALDGGAFGKPFNAWLQDVGAFLPVHIDSGAAFNIIYSSGTTGEPKGIVQSHGMRWSHIQRGAEYGYGPDTVALLSTPLYSNTTLVVFIPTLAFGGTIVMMPKFNAAAYLQLAVQKRVTHTMLVPVQYQRLMARPEFDDCNLGSYRTKFCTSAPFSAALKADVLKRWPGGLIEFYGMTEGGGSCILEAHVHPDKLHTVGKPAQNHDIRLIDEQGVEVLHGTEGEVVGHSGSMMTGYHGLPDKTREAEWFDPSGKRFIRTGDIGKFDEDGFLTLFDRKKDMIISGGFNIYPSDLEAVARAHPAVADVAVVGFPSQEWGETPAACVVARPGMDPDPAEIKAWVNAKVGKMQRISIVELMDELPRNAIGKVLKRELRDKLSGAATS